MLPKRPVSCLAVLVIPIGLILLLVVLGGYVAKFLSSDAPDTQNEQVSPTSTATNEPSIASRLPASLSATTTLFVATASASSATEDVYLVDAAGQVTPVKQGEVTPPERWKTAGITLVPPEEFVTSSPWRITGNGWNVALRTPGGSVWQDPVILGMFASGRAAIVAYRTQRALLSVGKAGDIQVVEVLDDALSPLAVHGSAAWFMRAPQLEDAPLETLPTGPSELVRLSERGTSSTIAQDPGIIVELVPGLSPSSLAYLSSDGSLVIVKEDTLHSAAKGARPLAWLTDRYLLVSSGGKLGWIDTEQPGDITQITEFARSIRWLRVATAPDAAVVH